jgi:prepilin-type N-terminal cleavage/methylation domain-containing protein
MLAPAAKGETAMGNRDGFTLLELVIVVGIMAVVTALAAPNAYRWMSKRRLVSAVDELYVVFQKARVRAVRENTDVVIRFDSAKDECEAFVDNGAGGGTAQNRVRDGGEARVEMVALPEGVNMYAHTFGAGQPWCGFDNRGVTINANNLGGQVHISGGANRYLGIGTNIAGNVRIIQSDDGVTWY